MKMKHIIGIVVLVLFAGIGLVVYKAVSSLDQIILASIEKYGSDITQSEISLDSVTLDLGTGTAALHGLNVGNPEGFKTEYAIRLDEVKLVLDIGSITKDPIVVKEILVQGPAVIYEMASGGSNIDAILKNVDSYTGAGETDKSDTAAEEGSGPKLIIDDFYVNSGQVSVSHSALKGKTLTTPLPDIHLEDIGKEDEGATPGEVAKEFFASLKSGIGTGISAMGADQLPGAISEQFQGAKDMAGKGGSSVKEGMDKAGEKIKGFFQ